MKKQLLTATAIKISSSFGFVLTILASISSAHAWDGQTVSAWGCKPAGNESQSSAVNLKYAYDGTIYNNSTTSTIGVLCPILKKEKNSFINHVSINYTDSHPSKAVRCTLRVTKISTGKNLFIYSPVGVSGTGTRRINIENTNDSNGAVFIYCSLPPKSNNKRSSINSIFVNQNEGPEPSFWCKYTPISCFDTSGVGSNKIPGIVGQVVSDNHSGTAAYFTSTGSIGNLSYDEPLEVVFPLVRDITTKNETLSVGVYAEIKGDENALAQCQLNQTNDFGGQETSYYLNSTTSNTGRVVFRGTGDASSMNANTVFSVKCVLPPRSSSGYSRIFGVAFSE